MRKFESNMMKIEEIEGMRLITFVEGGEGETRESKVENWNPNMFIVWVIGPIESD